MAAGEAGPAMAGGARARAGLRRQRGRAGDLDVVVHADAHAVPVRVALRRPKLRREPLPQARRRIREGAGSRRRGGRGDAGGGGCVAARGGRVRVGARGGGRRLPG